MRNTGLVLIALAALLLSAPRAAAGDVDRDLEARIAQVIYNTMHMERRAEPPPDDAVDRMRLEGDGGISVYEYSTANLEDDDLKRIGWRFQVRVLPEGWEPDAASEAKWAKQAAGVDAKTGGARAFLQSKGGIRRTKVYFRLREGGIKLVMAITREGTETRDEAIRKAERRWHFFVEEAQRLGLFERVRIVVKALPPVDARGKGIADDPLGEREALESGELLTMVHDHRQRVEMPLRVRAEGPGIVDDEPYELRIALKDALGRAGVQLMDAAGHPLADRDPQGRFVVQVPRGDTPVGLSLRFGAYALGHGAALRDRVLDQVGQVRVQYVVPAKKDDTAGTDAPVAAPDVKAQFDLAVQRGDWWPVVTRFQLEAQEARHDPGYGQKPEIEELKDPRYRRSFNAYRIQGADLKDGWDKLYPFVKARRGYPEGASAAFPVYEENEPVILGWRRNPRTPGGFFTAEVGPEHKWVPGFTKQTRFYLLADVEIVGPRLPKKETKFDYDMGGSEDLEMEDPLDAQRRLRRFINVAEYRMVIRRIAERGIGAAKGADAADAYRRFKRTIRLPSGTVGIRSGDDEREELIAGRRRGVASLDRYFPLESKVPRYFEVFATPGVYEVRLLLDLYYKSPENSKKLDVALRYNCVDATFEVDTLSLESERR